jgi:hypothetical protein
MNRLLNQKKPIQKQIIVYPTSCRPNAHFKNYENNIEAAQLISTHLRRNWCHNQIYHPDLYLLHLLNVIQSQRRSDSLCYFKFKSSVYCIKIKDNFRKLSLLVWKHHKEANAIIWDPIVLIFLHLTYKKHNLFLSNQIVHSNGPLIVATIIASSKDIEQSKYLKSYKVILINIKLLFLAI